MRKRCNLEHFYVLKTFFHVKHFSHVKHFYLPTYPYFSLTVTINIFKFSRSLLNKLTVNRLPPPFKPIRIRINKPRAAEGGTHLTSLARDIFWSQKSQLYIVNSYSWEILFSQNIPIYGELFARQKFTDTRSAISSAVLLLWGAISDLATTQITR